MRRFGAIALLAVAAATSPIAWANSPEPSPETIAAITNTCTADGAFGYRFGERKAIAHDTGLAPFAIETLSASRDGLFEIVAAASFAKAPMSGEDRVALAGWVFGKLDAGAAMRKFSRREPRRDGVRYIASAFVFNLSRDGTTVHVTCTDIARKTRAREEMRR